MDEAFARVAIVGTSCSGKSTLARQLAPRLGAAHIELDALYWGPNWSAASDTVFRARVEAALSAPRWVCDGNYRAVQDLVLEKATMVVWLDYGLPLMLWRALARTLRRVVKRESLYGGNRETLARAFLSRDSIPLWVLHTHRARRRRYTARFGREDSPWRVVRLRHPGETARFLETSPLMAPIRDDL